MNLLTSKNDKNNLLEVRTSEVTVVASLVVARRLPATGPAGPIQISNTARVGLLTRFNQF